MDISDIIKSSLAKSKEVINETLDRQDFRLSLQQASELIIDTYNNKGKVMLAGNGGSAADSQHICAEFVGRFNFNRPPLPAIALTTNTSNLTCISNDYGYKNVFSRQLEAHGESNDTLIVYSTSGSSENILELVKIAKPLIKNVIAMIGSNTEYLKDSCDVIISVNSTDTPKIQEVHAIAGHMICEAVEHALFGKP